MIQRRPGQPMLGEPDRVIGHSAARVMSERNEVLPMTGAERAALFRRRKRDGLVSVRFDLRETEIDVMTRHGLLAADQRTDQGAIVTALGMLVDRAVAALEAGALPEAPE
jgi:hypothetical protein